MDNKDIKFPERIEDVELVDREGQIRPGDHIYFPISPEKVVLGEVVYSSDKILLSYSPEGRITRGAEIPVRLALVLRRNEDGSEQFLAGRDAYDFVKISHRLADLAKGLRAKLESCQSQCPVHGQAVNQGIGLN